MEKTLDLVIIGAGAAGMTAAIYASRAQLDFVIIEKTFPGGQITNTYEIENYPGVKMASGFELVTMFNEHLTSFGIEIKTEEVQNLDLDEPIKTVTTNVGQYKTKTVIMATGANPRKLGLEGETKYAGKGVSYCATCDGAFYKGKTTLVTGGGDVAVEDAIYLARMCEKVYLVHRRDELRAVKVLQEKLFNTPNVEIIWDSVIDQIEGQEFVNSVVVSNKKTGQQRTLAVDGVFVAIGYIPSTKLLEGKVELDGGKYVITGENCMTNVEGVFAAGDLRQKSLRQVITACGDGATAVFSAERYV